MPSATVAALHNAVWKALKELDQIYIIALHSDTMPDLTVARRVALVQRLDQRTSPDNTCSGQASVVE